MNVVDVGSGAFPISRYFEQKHKTILIDVAGKNDQIDSTLYLKADVESMADRTRFSTRRALLKSALFLGVDPHASGSHVDTFLFSEILNYVDWRETIDAADAQLKNGGTMFIANMPNRGLSSLFSERGLTSNAALLSYFQEEKGYSIVHEQYMNRSKPDSDTDFLFLLVSKPEA